MKSLLLTIIVLAGQSQATAPVANGTIVGSVMLSGTSQPLEGVLVVADFRGNLQATTDTSGHFAIKDVPPGRYFVFVQDQRYARPPKGGYSKNVLVGAGEIVNGVDLTMFRTGIVSGRVTRPDGQPVVGAEVAAIPPDYRAGQIILPGACCTWRTARTDASGSFRISTVEPGEYYVSVSRNASFYDRQYFPGTADPQIAQPVVVTQGTEIVVNIQYQTVPTFKVSGKIIDDIPGAGTHQVEGLYLKNRNIRVRDDASSDEFSSPSVLSSIPPSVSTNVEMSISASRDQFEIRGVKTGTYDLFAVVSDRRSAETNSPTKYIGRMEIEVRDQDVSGANVVVRPGIDVDVTTPIAGYNNLRLIPRDNTPVPASAVGVPLAAEMDMDGKMRVHNVSPGIYSIRMDQSTSYGSVNAFVADVRQNGQSIFDSGLTVGTTPVNPIEVTITNNGATIQGTVQSPEPLAAPYSRIALVPNAPRRANVQLYKWVIADLQGRFAIHGVAPGEYKLFAFEDAPLGALQNSDFIAHHESGGVPIHVEPDATLTMEPTLISMP